MRIRATLSICFAALTLSGFAFAEVTECEHDAECGANGVCQKDMWADGCTPSEDGNTDHCNSEPMTAETGYCYTPPPTCENDAQCGEYLQCIPSDDGVCWADSNGNSGCSEPDPDAPKYCGQATVACDNDGDCPREFECLAAPGECLLIPCAEDEPDCGCSSPTHKECQPRAIECENDSECPEDWMCFGGAVDCGASDNGADGDNGDNSDSAESGDGSDVGELIAPECDSSLKGQCYPTEWNSAVGTAGGDVASGDSSGESNDGGGGPRTSSDGESSTASAGGCSVSRTSSSGSWLLGFLMFPLLAVRRRRGGSA